MAKSKTRHIVISSGVVKGGPPSGLLWCCCCGVTQSLNLPSPVNVVHATMRQFRREHLECIRNEAYKAAVDSGFYRYWDEELWAGGATLESISHTLMVALNGYDGCSSHYHMSEELLIRAIKGEFGPHDMQLEWKKEAVDFGYNTHPATQIAKKWEIEHRGQFILDLLLVLSEQATVKRKAFL